MKRDGMGYRVSGIGCSDLISCPLMNRCGTELNSYGKVELIDEAILFFDYLIEWGEHLN